MLLNNEWVSQKIKEKNLKIHGDKWKWKNNGPKSLGCSKSGSKREVLAIQTYLKKQEKSQLTNWATQAPLFPCNFFISYLISLLTVSLFSSMLFNLRVFVVFPDFSLWFSSSFIALWSEKIHGMTSIFLNLLRLLLWPNTGSILENISCALAKNVYSVVSGWNVLNISVKPVRSSVLFKAIVSLIFCLDDLSLGVPWCKWGVKVPYYYYIIIN